MIVSQLCIYPIKSCQGIQLQTTEVTAKGLLWDREMMVISQRGKFLTQRQFPQLAKVKVQINDDLVTLSTSDGSLKSITFVPTLQGREIAVEIWQDNTIAIDQGEQVAQWFHEVLELDSTKQCRLVRQSPQYNRKVKRKLLGNQSNIVSFADSYPCLLTTTASLKELNRHILDNYQDASKMISMDRFRSNIVVETQIPFDEDHWKMIRIGEVKFTMIKPCSRCIITTVDQQTGDRDKLKEPLRTLGTFRQFSEQGVMFGENMIPSDFGRISLGDRLEIVAVR